jgi:hypothetical protein
MPAGLGQQGGVLSLITGASANPEVNLSYNQVLELATIVCFAIPILITSAALVYVTRVIRSLQNQFRLQMMVFRGILTVGYVFFIAGLALFIEETSELAGNSSVATVARLAWHGATLVALIILTLSFLQYLRVLRHQT